MDALEKPTSLLSFWDAASALNVEEAAEKINDASLPWINRNNERCIDRLSRNKKMQLQSKLRFYLKYILNADNYGEPCIDLDEFKKALLQPVTLWRGGGGVYDPTLPQREWVSFTASRRRTITFTKYSGTHAVKAWRLPERQGAWWIVELSIPLKDILLYLPHGSDDEVIIPKAWSEKARLVETNEGLAGGKNDTEE